MGKNGGARPGAGRKRVEFRFRRWCREVFVDPEIQENIKRAAKEDPLFALKLAEHGWGRPPQSLTVDVDDKRQGEFRAEFADGASVHPAALAELPN